MAKSWTAFQDALLVDAAHTFDKRWILVQDRLPGRSAKECEERFAYLHSIGKAQPFPKSPIKRELVRSTPPKKKSRIVSSPLNSRSRATKRPSPKLLKKILSPKNQKIIQARSSPAKKRSGTSTMSFNSKLVNRSPTKMNWVIHPPQIHNTKPINTLSNANWNIHQTNLPFYSSPVTGHDRDWPFSATAPEPVQSSPVVQQSAVIESSLFPDKPITLDDLFSFDDCIETSNSNTLQNDTSELEQLFQHMEPAPTFDLFQPQPVQTPLFDSNLLSSFADPIDPFVSSFALPPPDQQQQQTQGNDGFWNDFFSNTLAAPFQNEPTFSMENNQGFGIFNQSETDREEVADTPTAMTISKDEVDDLFKDAFQEPELRKSFEPGASQVNWVTNSSDAFSLEQVEILKLQLQQHFQLMIQAFCVEKALRGSESKEERKDFWESQVKHFMAARSAAMKRFGKFTLLNVPGSERVSKLWSMPDPPNVLFQRHYRMKPRFKQVKALELPQTTVHAIGIFSDIFDPQLYPSIFPGSPKKISNFWSAEDELLFIGLVTFGPHDLASIQAHQLPAKSRVAIKNRIINSTRRHRPVSKLLLEYHVMPFKPLTILERFILKQGILKYGFEFKNVLDVVFPNSPSSLLSIVWNDLCRTGQIPYNWDGDRVNFAYIPPAPIIKSIPNPPKPKKTTKKKKVVVSSETDVPTPQADCFTQTPQLFHEEPVQVNSPLRKVESWNSDFETDIEESKPLSDVSLNKSVERPKVSFAGFYDMDSDVNENIVNSPTPCSSPVRRSLCQSSSPSLDKPIAGNLKKKRTKVSKDLIDPAKLRRKFADTYRPPRSMDYKELQKTFKVFVYNQKRKQKPVPKFDSTIEVIQMKKY